MYVHLSPEPCSRVFPSALGIPISEMGYHEKSRFRLSTLTDRPLPEFLKVVKTELVRTESGQNITCLDISRKVDKYIRMYHYDTSGYTTMMYHDEASRYTIRKRRPQHRTPHKDGNVRGPLAPTSWPGGRPPGRQPGCRPGRPGVRYWAAGRASRGVRYWSSI